MTDSPYDHPDWAAFVAGIRENPDDDLRRLVAADWLEERGEGERAKDIRDWVRIGPGTRSSPDLDLRPGSVSRWYCRGFCDRVRCPWSWWAEHGDTLCRREPVRRVELTTEPDTVVYVILYDDGKTAKVGWNWEGQSRTKMVPHTFSYSQEGILSALWPAIPVDGWVLPQVRNSAPEPGIVW